MAIKVNGTTVIDDSRNLVNIASGAGSSTTFGDVGTYTIGRPSNGSTTYAQGATASSMRSFGWYNGSASPRYGNSYNEISVSGTWRCMAPSNATNDDGWLGLWVRIS